MFKQLMAFSCLLLIPIVALGEVFSERLVISQNYARENVDKNSVLADGISITPLQGFDSFFGSMDDEVSSEDQYHAAPGCRKFERSSSIRSLSTLARTGKCGTDGSDWLKDITEDNFSESGGVHSILAKAELENERSSSEHSHDTVSKSPWVDVRTFGAKGDGVTDDTVAIQAAINSLVNSGSVIIPFTESGYKITSGISISASKVSLIGIGLPRIFTSKAIKMITVGNGLGGSRKTENKITGLELDGGGIALGGIITNGIKNFSFNYNRILKIAGPAVEITKPGPNGDFAGEIEGNTLILNNYPIKTHSNNNQIIISRNYIEHNNYGILIDSDGLPGSEGIEIEGNQIQYNGPYELELRSSTTGVNIKTNYFETGSPAISEFGNPGCGSSTDSVIKLGSGAKVYQITIENNYIFASCGKAAYGIEAVSVSSITVKENQISNFSVGQLLSTSVDSGLWVDNFGGGTINTSPSSNTNWTLISRGQITSGIPHGTAPFSVTSSTPVPNLDVYAKNVTATSSNDNAAPGQLGEYVFSDIPQKAEISLGSGISTNITSILLSSGDWEVSGSVVYDPGQTTNITNLQAGISLGTEILPTTEYRYQWSSSGQVPLNQISGAIPSQRLSLSGTTTVYLVASGVFTVNTLKSYGVIRARRVR